MGHGSAWAVLRWKGAILVRLFTDHADPLTGVLSWAGLLAALGIAALRARWRAVPALAAAAAILAACALAFPEAAGMGSLLDYRLVLPALLLAAAATRLSWRSDRARRAAFALLAGVVLLRSASFALAFSGQAQVFRAFDAIVRTLPAGSIVLTARGRTDPDIPVQEWWNPPMEHVATRAVLRRMLVPTVFAVASQQPVVLKPALDPWRNEWRIADAAELSAFVADVAPLCAASARTGRHVFLFIAYPGRTADLIAPDAVIAAAPAFRIVEACEIQAPPRFAGSGQRDPHSP